MKITEKHLELIWLCFACPKVMPHSNCVLQKYRNEIVKGSTDLLEKLSTDQANTLVKTHEKCLQERIKERINEKLQESLSTEVE